MRLELIKIQTSTKLSSHTRKEKLHVCWIAQCRPKGCHDLFLFWCLQAVRGNLEAWLTDVLNRLPDQSILKLDELLPHNWKPAETK